MIAFNIHVQSLIASCKDQQMIDDQQDPGALSNLIKKWEFEAECSFIVGRKFLSFFESENDQKTKNMLFNDARIYLEKARFGLGETSDDYRECHKLLIKIEANSVTPNLERVYNFIQIPGMQVDDTDKDLIIRAIDHQLNPYITVFTVMDYPPNYIIELYQTLNPESLQRINSLSSVHQFKESYQNISRKLETNTSQNKLNDINTIIQSLNSHNNMEGIQPFITAYTSWRRALRYMLDLPQTASERCTQCTQLIQELNTIRLTLPFFQTPDDINCCRVLSCLVFRHSLQDVLPVYNDEQNKQKFMNCKTWIEAYTTKINTCGTIYLIEDQRPFLNELTQLYNAINTYHKRASITGINNIYTKTLNGNIKIITGQYLANYYYKIVTSELKRGKMNNTDELTTLNNIESTLGAYNQYSRYIKQANRFNINEQHRLLTKFFTDIHSNINSAQNTLSYIDKELKRIWKVETLYLAKKEVADRAAAERAAADRAAAERAAAERAAADRAAAERAAAERAAADRAAADRAAADRAAADRAAADRAAADRAAADRAAAERAEDDRAAAERAADDRAADDRAAAERAAADRAAAERAAAARKPAGFGPAFEAREAFDKFDYFKAWDHYSKAYIGIVPNRLEDLVNESESSNIVNNVWGSISSQDRIRLKILSLIIRFTEVHHHRPMFTMYVENRSGYPEQFSFHLAERGHLSKEKSSDQDFISALCYMKEASNQGRFLYPLEMLKHLCAAYHALGQGSSSFSLSSIKRVHRKKQRLEYWLLRVWKSYDESRRNLARSEYYRFFPSIFNTILHDNIGMIQPSTIAPAKARKPTFEKRLEFFEVFAAVCEKKGKTYLNCDQMRKSYDNRIEGNDTAKCVEKYIKLIRRHEKKSTDYFYRFYRAWAKIRKAQGRVNDWIENLIIAYTAASNEAEKTIVKKSIKEALQKLNEPLNKKIEKTITKYKLTTFWKKLQAPKIILSDYQFENPEQAKKIAEQLLKGQCKKKKNDIILFLTNLVTLYRDTQKNNYREVFNNYISRYTCLSAREVSDFHTRINSVTN